MKRFILDVLQGSKNASAVYIKHILNNTILTIIRDSIIVLYSIIKDWLVLKRF